MCGPPTPTTHSSILMRATRSACSLAALHRFGRRAKLGDQPLAHPRRLHHAVAAIAQSASHSGRPPARASRRCRCRAPRSGCPASGSSRSPGLLAGCGRTSWLGRIFACLQFSAARCGDCRALLFVCGLALLAACDRLSQLSLRGFADFGRERFAPPRCWFAAPATMPERLAGRAWAQRWRIRRVPAASAAACAYAGPEAICSTTCWS